MTEPETEVEEIVGPDEDETMWHRPLPYVLPRQTYMPAFLSLGIVLLFWGFITTPVMCVVGLIVMGFGIAGWIGELQFESRQHESERAGASGEP